MSRHLMAKMRRAAAWADWAKVGTPEDRSDVAEMMLHDPTEFPETEYHVAPLESGHELHVYNYVDYDENYDPVVNPSKGFSWHVWDPYEPDVLDAGGAFSQQHMLSPDMKGRTHHIPTLEQAMDEAEASYISLVKGGLRGLQGHPNHPGMGF